MAIVTYRNKTTERIAWTVRVLLVTAVLIFFMFPIFWIISTAFKYRIDMFSLPPTLFSKPTIENFVYVFSKMEVELWTFNSITISLGTMVLALVLGVPAGYAFARVHFRGKYALLMTVLLTRALPPIVLALPFRVMMQEFGLLGTRVAVILIDTVYNSAFTFWLMSGMFEAVPKDLEESALIDGASPFQAFWKIAVPLSKPGLVTSALFAFIFSWNDFLFALTLTSPETATLPLGMLSTYGILQQGWTLMAAMGVVAIVPVIIFSMMLQRYYVSGLTFGGIK
jgi:multiple sugar transport system permease protein